MNIPLSKAMTLSVFLFIKMIASFRSAFFPFRKLILAFGICLIVANLSASDTKVDVLVYGATPAGVCAAIGAAREGTSVALVEPTSHIGGVNSGGLCFSDSNQMV